MSDVSSEYGPRVLVVYLSDSRVVGPFADAAAATAWLRAVPNRLFDTLDDLEHARANADVWLAPLEGPDDGPATDVTYPDEWEEDWSVPRGDVGPR